MKKPRNPFAGQKQTGAGYHSAAKYGKKDRQMSKEDFFQEDMELSTEGFDILFENTRKALEGFKETREYLENELKLCQAEIDAIKSEEQKLKVLLLNRGLRGGKDGQV